MVKVLLLHYPIPYAPPAGGQVVKVFLPQYLLPYAPPPGGKVVRGNLKEVKGSDKQT